MCESHKGPGWWFWSWEKWFAAVSSVQPIHKRVCHIHSHTFLQVEVFACRRECKIHCPDHLRLTHLCSTLGFLWTRNAELASERNELPADSATSIYCPSVLSLKEFHQHLWPPSKCKREQQFQLIPHATDSYSHRDHGEHFAVFCPRQNGFRLHSYVCKRSSKTNIEVSKEIPSKYRRTMLFVHICDERHCRNLHKRSTCRPIHPGPSTISQKQQNT